MDKAALDDALRNAFPFRDARELVSLEYVELLEEGDFFHIVVRVVIWDDHEETRSIRDVKEQQLAFVAKAAEIPLDRIVRYLAALERVLPRVLGHTSVETLMPYDLFDSTVLKLKTTDSIDDFVKALSARSRLGHLLPPAEGPSRIPELGTGKRPTPEAFCWFGIDALLGPDAERSDVDGRRHYRMRGIEIAILSLVEDDVVLDFLAPGDRTDVDNRHVQSVKDRDGWLRFRRPATRDPKPNLAAKIGAILGRLRFEHR